LNEGKRRRKVKIIRKKEEKKRQKGHKKPPSLIAGRTEVDSSLVTGPAEDAGRSLAEDDSWPPWMKKPSRRCPTAEALKIPP
jgi:hypothetical protein